MLLYSSTHDHWRNNLLWQSSGLWSQGGICYPILESFVFQKFRTLWSQQGIFVHNCWRVKLDFGNSAFFSSEGAICTWFLNGLHLRKRPSPASNSVGGCLNYWVPLSSSFNLWFATFMSDLCHCSLWHNPKQIENHFPMSCLNSWGCTHTCTHMHLKIFVRYPNSFYWWSRFKDELQAPSNKESLGIFRMGYQKGHTLNPKPWPHVKSPGLM
jgi:hypothetical protein